MIDIRGGCCDGCWLLVVGCWLLVVGCWLLVVVVVVVQDVEEVEEVEEIGEIECAVTPCFWACGDVRHR